MNKLLSLLVFVLMSTPYLSEAQWRLQTVGKEDLFGVWASSLKDLYVVGASGAILHSTDNGLNFTQEIVETKETLYGVGGTGPDNVVVVGANGTLLHSTDRGKTWLPRSAGTRVSLRAVWASPAGQVFVVGEQGTILRSQDGIHWESLSSNSKSILYGIWGTSDALYVVGEQGLILRSTDKGASWGPLVSGTQENLRGIWGSKDAIFVVGYRGTILRSTDQGASWSPKQSGTQEWLASICGSDESTLYAVGAQGIILKSTDSGESWSAQPGKVTTPNYAVVALSPVHIYSVGRKGSVSFLSPSKPLLVLRATDGDTSAEGADVYIGETLLGQVPLSVEVSVGEHVLLLKKPGYRAVVYTINLKEGDIYNLPVRAQEAQVAFLKAVSSIQIAGPDGAEVYLDAEKQGVAPLTINEVTRGPHLLMFKKEGYENSYVPIDVDVQNAPFSAVMTKRRDAAPAQELGIPTRHRFYQLALAGGGLGSVAFVSGLVQTRRARDASIVGEGGVEDAIEEITRHQKAAKALGLVSDVCFGVAILSGGTGLVIDRLNKRSEATISLTLTGATFQMRF
jgi:photosystem II stability/assembly factor-like uncharacterized protein